MPPFADCITTETKLREWYRQPAELTQRKVIGLLDDHGRAFIAHAPFVLIGTAAPDGTADVSPKGGPPGSSPRSKSAASRSPILPATTCWTRSRICCTATASGCFFLIPGLDETLRVNGRGYVTRDPDVLAACEVKDRRPTAAIGVEVVEAFIHCAKAFRRGGVWNPDAWPDRSELPTAACMLRDHVELTDVPESVVADALEDDYRTSLWEPGGNPA